MLSRVVLRRTRHDAHGISSSDFARGIATDANGNVFATIEAVVGDAFIYSYDSDGGHRWTRQFGTSSNVYTTGHNSGALEGSNAGIGDAFIRSYGR